MPRTFDAVDDAIDANGDLAEAILEAGLPAFGVGPGSDAWRGQATPNDMDKARSTIRQFYRDWSAEGLPERQASYSPVLLALGIHLSSAPSSQRHRHRVLVPGAGLGRLVFDICAAGYRVEGNEISYHQLLASNYILNCTKATQEHRLYPWALSFSNHTSRANQLQSVFIPDVHPATALEESCRDIQTEVHYSERMSMTAGDFCVLYRQIDYKDTFDAVVTCFFLDTAPNVVSYIETVKHCLQPRGIWVNLGPLLWHFEAAPTPAERNKRRQNSETEQHSHYGASFHVHESDRNGTKHEGIGEAGSFELSNDETIALVSRFGFEILEQKSSDATGYIQDPTSMLQNVYWPAFWVARKL